MKIDCDHIGYEVSWEDSLLDVVDNFIHRVFQRTVLSDHNQRHIASQPKVKGSNLSPYCQI